jgi:broad specificity phosphatase PhoE
VRHAEVENPNHIVYVCLPGFKLSKVGYFQAEKLREYFKDKKIAAIYSSPLLRTKQTSKIISDGKIPIFFSQNLTEGNFKKWEGLRSDQRPKKEVKIYGENPTRLEIGETLDEMQKRMHKEIMKIIKKNQGKNIIVVSHADPIIVTRLSLKNKSLDLLNETKHANAGIATLVFNDKCECIHNNYVQITPAKKDWV